MADNGAVVDLTQSDEDEQADELKMVVPMCPMAKASVSYGPGRGGGLRAYFNNDVTRAKKQFADHVRAAASAQGFQMIERSQPVTIKVWCFLKRPKDDFVSKRREAGNLRPSALDNTVIAIKPDTDNLAKFVLDSLTGVVYADDAQIVDLHMLKMRDSEGLCNGRVAFAASRFSGDWQSLMPDF